MALACWHGPAISVAVSCSPRMWGMSCAVGLSLTPSLTHSLQVVLDNFLDEPTRSGLLEALTAPGWQGANPPQPKWERRTADAAERPPTWGLQSSVLAGLADGDLPAKLEVQSRLCKL